MTTNLDFTEIYKLDTMLTKAGIPHTFRDLFDGKQIRLYADGMMQDELDDAVIHFGSIGSREGLLESCCLGECSGRETADQIFKGWMEMYLKAQPYRSSCNCSIIGAGGEEWEGSMPSWD